MTPRTVMRSGSMGKTYTATAVMQLVEGGHLGLHAPANDHLDFEIRNPLGARDVTVHDLLTHRSGLASNGANSTMRTPRALGEHLRTAYAGTHHEYYDGATVPMWLHPVGETFTYSNLGMATLGYLVERANPEGLSFSDYQQRHVIDRLGLTSTQYPPVQDAAHVRPDIWAEASTGYARFGGAGVPTPEIYFADFPAGGVMTTPGDHIRVLLAYLRGGDPLLRPETVAEMLRVHVPDARPDTGTAIGLAWMLMNLGRDDECFYHGGAHMFGWQNDYRAYPKLGLAIATATNSWPMIGLRAEGVKSPLWQIPEFAVEVLRGLRTGRRVPEPRTWAWKASYLMGLTFAEQTFGMLGIDGTLDEAVLERMASGVAVAPGFTLWDADGFRAGVRDLLAAGRTPDAISAFVRSDRCRIHPAELELLSRDLGATGPLPVPSLPS